MSLGGKERLENAIEIFFADSNSLVPECDLDPFAADLACFDCQHAAIRHRVYGIAGETRENLHQLIPARTNGMLVSERAVDRTVSRDQPGVILAENFLERFMERDLRRRSGNAIISKRPARHVRHALEFPFRHEQIW